MKTERLGSRLMVVFGPPGTGKTTRMLELLESELEQGIPSDEIAFVTFTRAARAEARDRAVMKFGLSPEQLTWFRTLHSTGLRLMAWPSDKLMNPKRQKEFNARYLYDLTIKSDEEDGDEIRKPPQQTRDDNLRAVHDWGRHRLMTPRDAWAKSPMRVDIDQLERYVRCYSEFKAEHKLIDFNDMLERGAELEGPPVRVAFVDEAQDLTPLQISACYSWFAHCERVYVAGDDDQAIYLWAGASPRWMLELREVATHCQLLDQSYRVPSAVQRVANTIIKRNRERVDKPYRSAKPGGTVTVTTRRKVLEHIASHAGDENWTTFVLVRNRMFGQKWAREFLRLGIPYRADFGPPGPLGKKRLPQAVLAAHKLLKGRDIDGTDLRALMDFIPSKAGKLPRGTKTRARGFKGQVTRMQLILEWGLAELVKRLEEFGPARGLFKEKEETLEYLDLVLKRLGTLPKRPNLAIRTIHGAKGSEANTVVIDSDMAKASWREWQTNEEGENRVAYVAVTRAKDELLICDPETPRHYPYWEFVKPEPLEEVPF